MKILLDTNALIWILDNNKSLGKQSKKLLSDADLVLASAVNIIELRIKSLLNKVSISDNLLNDIEHSGIDMLSITATHADELKRFSNLNRHDPFDRLLLAQASSENIYLMTSDKMLLDYNFNFLINARI